MFYLQVLGLHAFEGSFLCVNRIAIKSPTSFRNYLAKYHVQQILVDLERISEDLNHFARVSSSNFPIFEIMKNLDDFFDRMVCHRRFLPLDNNLLQVLSEVIDPKEVKVSNTIEAQNWNTKRNKDKNLIDFLCF